ncbi:MAG: DUF3883 domain-containing protein [Deltaproteobacteria bacterium]|jgi:SNF2 family DNA or RNA helicase|nr:DUF3883 domain-containing protein [Deltaproteobacteria bacterium]
MVRLENLTVGARLIGLQEGSVRIISVAWHGANALEITYKNSKGVLGNQLLFREDEERLELEEKSLPFSFSAEANALRLVSEAHRISLAHLFDPYLAIHTSAVEALPHQISAVYQEMLKRLPLRFILADDPGAGKTIMTGLLLKELLVRGDLRRCLIVTPGNLCEQWQDELRRKFNLSFKIISKDLLESAASGNIFSEINLCLCRLDKLSRNEDIQEKLRAVDWDLIVCDEAHKMSATVWGDEIKYTKRFQLGRLLSSIARHFLLLTATPHNGKEKDFQLFLSLIDQDRFEGAQRSTVRAVDVSDVMRRLLKEDLLKFDGTPLFPERRAYTINYDLSDLEAKLYTSVTDYVRQEFNRADNLEKERKNTVGFALTILQRRLASSPEAIYQSLKRRRERLENRLAEERLGKRASLLMLGYDDDFDQDELPSAELEEAENKVVDQASASQTIAELEAEISSLKALENMANRARQSGEDRKWLELSKLLQGSDNIIDGQRAVEKLIIFTEHRDTLNYLTHKTRSLLGSHEAVVTIHGGLPRDDRRKIEELFKQDKAVRILIATDAAGEGINLQRAHLMVNYDLPWNPNRLEQRFGRIHRIGQTEVCHLWNLVAKETREGMVFQRLFAKLEQAREALKGKVFDVLGQVTFDNKSLRELLIEAVRYNNLEEVRERLFQTLDKALNREELQKLIDQHALTGEAMDVSQVMAIRAEIERWEARKLQPYFVESFFLEAFKGLGGKIHRREKGRYEITSVPFAVRNRDMQIGTREPVLKRYERVCFDKIYSSPQGGALADIIAPGHPLIDATIDLVRERNMETLKKGAIFIDEQDLSLEARLLFYLEDSVQDAILLPNGNKRVISKRLHFIEINKDGAASDAGCAPYLDYRAALEEELPTIREFIDHQPWLKTDLEELALNHAVSNLIPSHVAEVRERRIKLIEKIAKAVKERLSAEITYWDFRSEDLKDHERAGKTNAKLNSQTASRRAEDLSERLKSRLSELEKEKLISAAPPVLVGGAIVIPAGLLSLLTNSSHLSTAEFALRREVELKAMKAVMAIETSLGNIPSDVSASKVGYDVESKTPSDKRGPEGATLRFIEVKGRVKGAQTVTVTKNEILAAFNKPNDYILAIVEVDGESTKTVYLKKPFLERPDFAASSVNYSLGELVAQAQTLLKREG